MKTGIKVYARAGDQVLGHLPSDVARRVLGSNEALKKVGVQMIGTNYYRVYTYGVILDKAALDYIARGLHIAVRIEYSTESPETIPCS